MFEIFISNFQTKNLCVMRNFKKIQYPHHREYYDVINQTCFSKIKKFCVAHRIFCVFAILDRFLGRNRKKLMAYLLKIREIPTSWSNFQVDILKNDEVIDFRKKYFEKFRKWRSFAKTDSRNIRFFGNGRW